MSRRLETINNNIDCIHDRQHPRRGDRGMDQHRNVRELATRIRSFEEPTDERTRLLPQVVPPGPKTKGDGRVESKFEDYYYDDY